jgi:hypothetical protein
MPQTTAQRNWNQRHKEWGCVDQYKGCAHKDHDNQGHANQGHANQDRADQSLREQSNANQSWGISGTRTSGTRIRDWGSGLRGSEGQEPGANQGNANQDRADDSQGEGTVTQIRVGGRAARGSAARESERSFSVTMIKRSDPGPVKSRLSALGLMRVTRIELGYGHKGYEYQGHAFETHANQGLKDHSMCLMWICTFDPRNPQSIITNAVLLRPLAPRHAKETPFEVKTRTATNSALLTQSELKNE